MFEEQQTSNADSVDLTEGESGDAMSDNPPNSAEPATDPQEEVLKTLSSVSGREYKSIDDAKKHLENLNRMVGNPRLREDAEMLEKVVRQLSDEQNITMKEAREQLASITSKSPQKKEAEPRSTYEVPDEVQKKLDDLERATFLTSNPEAKPYVDRIESYAKNTKMSLADAYSFLFADLVSKSKEEAELDGKREAKRTAQVSASSSSTAPKAFNQREALLKKYRQTGDDKFLHEAMKLRFVKEDE